MVKHGIELGKKFGRYQLIAPLASGGMADIYLASVGGIGGFEKLVVLKCILPSLAKDPRFVKMLLNEARLAAILEHPNIVQVFDVGCIEGQYYIAMEYLSGEALNTLLGACRKREQLPPVEMAAAIVMQAAEGLHYAHNLVGKDGASLNIIHRDVSPQNIFVLYNGAIKVVDFGIAKARTTDNQTRTGAIKGKIAYMSPEQVLGEDLDARSDVFSLGIVLWECLTCRRLFKKDTEYSLMETIVREVPPSPVVFVPGLPAPLVAITEKALKRNRTDRFASAAEMRAALAGFLRGWPQTADTVAVGQWMQTVFADRIQRKRALIDGALDQHADSDENLFSELGKYATGGSAIADLLEGDEPDDGRAAPTVEIKNVASGEVMDRRPTQRMAESVTGVPRPRRRLALLVGAGGGAVLLMAALWLLARPHPPVVTPTPDAHAVVVPPLADAGQVALLPHDAAVVLSRPDAAVLDQPGKRPIKVVRSRAVGTINVACLPWCEIIVDGKRTGRNSPLQDYELAAGPHMIEVVNPPTGARDQKRITVKKDEQLQLQFRLQ